MESSSKQQLDDSIINTYTKEEKIIMARFDRFALDAWDEFEYEEAQGKSWDKHVDTIDDESGDLLEEDFNGVYSVS